MRTLLIGLDGASLSLLQPMFSNGLIPTIQSIFNDGVSGDLQSQVPPWTPSAWPSIYTGTNPGKHGVYGFLEFDGYDWELTNASNVDEWSLWEICSEQDLRSVIVNVPVTYPPPKIDGAIIPGYLAPEDPRCHPNGILADVRRKIGEYRIYPPKGGEVDDTQLLSELHDLVKMRGDAFRYLCDRFDPDFGFIQFQQTDTVVHEFPGDIDRLQQIYRTVDREIESILEDCRPENIIVMSDHGMAAYREKFRINSFLRSEGYLKATKGGAGMPAWSTIRENQLRDGVDATKMDPRLVDRGLTVAAKVGLTSQRIGTTLDKLRLLDFVSRFISADAVRAASEQVDFPNSYAYMRSRPECGIRINLEGREPNGLVSDSEYEEIRDQLISVLQTATTPDGEPVFDDVAPREDYFHGPYVEKAPDIVTVPRNFDVYLGTWLLSELSERPSSPSWDHTLTGVFAATGEGINRSMSVSDAHIHDIAPTVLATLGISPTDRMDGTVLPIVESIDPNPYPIYTNGRSAKVSDQRVTDHLSSLGYLE